MTCIKCNDSIRLLGKMCHSFRIIENKETHAWFYTNEDEVLDRTPEFIVDHIRTELKEFHKKESTWSWYYDARGFQMDLNAIDLFLRLLDVFVQYGTTLQQIHIIPNPMLKTMLQFVQPMLPDMIRDMIFLE